MRSRSYIYLLITPFLLLHCSTQRNIENNYYKYSSPDLVLHLPEILHEISGLTVIDNNTFACIQDEEGLLFIYDLQQNKIKEQFKFNIAGDYEGICRVGENIYVLQSDGVIFEILDFETKHYLINSYHTGIPADNNEGLCYDALNNRLLVACKGKLGKGPEFKDKRVIYGFDLTTKKLSEEPVYEFDLQVIKQFAVDKKLNVPTRSKKKNTKEEPILKFAISAICLHPITGKLYVLSAADHLLSIFNVAGELEGMELLDPEMFNKSEGITFFENGDMLITNEGQDKKPSLLQFRFRR